MAALRIATLNLKKSELRWEERAPLVVQQIAELRPDIIGLQEVDLSIDQGNWLCGQLNDLTSTENETLNFRIHHMANPRDRVTLEALAIMTHLPVIAHEGFDYLFRNRVAHRIRVQTAGGDNTLDLWNTHLHHEQDGPGNAAREGQAKKLSAWITAQSLRHPTVLVGDFNCVPGTKPLLTLSERLTSVFESLGREAPATCPTPLEIKPYPGQWPLDHIFGTPNVHVLDAGLAFDQPAADDPTLYCSDHFGLVATIEIA
jgi:endonuclease/exonuclease/phosphatase family metal-dependent hydrolase